MGKKSFAILFVAVVAIFASYNIYQSQRAVHLSDLALANVEALASSGESLSIKCDSYSVVIKCERACWSCYRIWTAINGYGNSTGFSGTCVCGRTY